MMQQRVLGAIKKFFLNYDIYIYIYIIASILWFFPFLGPFMDIVSKLIFVWGGVILLYDFFIGKRMFKEQYVWVFFAFLLSYVISVLINFEGQLYMGIKHLLHSAIAMLILFNCAKDKDEYEIKSYIYRINNIVIMIAMIASAISVLMYYFSISIEMEYMGNSIRQGFIDHRLFGIYTSANTGATMSILVVAFMFINSYLKHDNMWKWNVLYQINFIIQLIYFSLTLSRGGQVTFYTFLTIFCVTVILPQLLQKQSKVKAIIKTISIYIIICCLTIVVPEGIREASMSVSGMIEKHIFLSEEKQEGNTDDTIEDDSTEIKRIESGDDMSNNRFTIWSGGVHVWEKSPLFGVADVRIDKEQLTNGIYDISNLSEQEISWLDRVDGNLHNSYIQILVNSGIVGTVIFVLLATLIGMKYLKYLFATSMQQHSSYLLVGMVFSLIISMLINCCFENRILFDRQNPYGLLFWVYLGIGCSLIDYKKGK